MAGAPWEVYSFEANPYIQPYVDKFASWLNHEGDKPAVVVPPAGSHAHLQRFSRRFGCGKKTTEAMRECMWNIFKTQIKSLMVNSSLWNKDLLAKRLAEAGLPNSRPHTSRYTFIPAAIGAQNGFLPINAERAKDGIIRGGNAGQTNDATEIQVPVVDVIRWAQAYFHVDDYILAKMDVEGAEHAILNEMMDTGALKLLDVLMMECHGECGKLLARIRHYGGPRLVLEGGKGGYKSIDSHSKVEAAELIDPRLSRP